MPTTSKTKWTPGPWKYNGPGTMDMRHVFAEIDGKTWVVATLNQSRISYGNDALELDEGTKDEAEANARLIANAPKMAELLADIARISHKKSVPKRTIAERAEALLRSLEAE